MPISREEFEKGKPEAAFRTLMKALLRDNSEMAFTVSEICDMLGERGGNALLEVVEQILLDLIREESVERKEIGGVLYYSYKTRPLGFRRG